MKKLSEKQILQMLKNAGFDTNIGWFCNQFENKFEVEYLIDDVSSIEAYGNLVDFLNKDEEKEVLFFPEPSDLSNIPAGIVETKELKDFLHENVDTLTNVYVADKALKWIFTISHEEDFDIVGDSKLVKRFLKSFKNAKCMTRQEVDEMWAKKKESKH